MSIKKWRNDRDKLARKLSRDNKGSNVVGILQAKTQALNIMTEETLAYWYCRMLDDNK